jgi:hypothetical protein
MELDDRQISELTGTGECYLHWHPDDRVVTNDTVKGVASQALVTSVSTNTSIGYSPDIVLVDTSAGNITITVPLAKSGNEVKIVKVAAPNTLTIQLSGSDLVYSNTNILVYTIGTALHLKGVDGGYILI